MEKRSSNRLIGYGILVFLSGFFAGTYWIKHFQWLILVGACMTFVGIYLFLKKTNLWAEFAFNDDDGFLTYFWNVLALKAWTAIFVLWMMVMVFQLLTNGHI